MDLLKKNKKGFFGKETKYMKRILRSKQFCTIVAQFKTVTMDKNMKNFTTRLMNNEMTSKDVIISFLSIISTTMLVIQLVNVSL